MNFLSIFISVFYSGIFLLILFTPIWFFGNMISLLFSQAQRQRIRARWLSFTLLGIVSTTVVFMAWQSYGPDLNYPVASERFANEPMTRALVAQADAIVEVRSISRTRVQPRAKCSMTNTARDFR